MKTPKPKSLPNSVRPLSQDEVNTISEWRDTISECVPPNKWSRLLNVTRERNLWPDDSGGKAHPDEDDWCVPSCARARQCAVFCLAVANGMTHAQACAESGFSQYSDFSSIAFCSIWGKMYTRAREEALAAIADMAASRLMANIQTGSDDGTRSASYALDWYRKSHGSQTEADTKTQASGIVYNISGPVNVLQLAQNTPNVDAVEAMVDPIRVHLPDESAQT